MSLFPMNREIRRAAKCRCYGCEDCNWRENLYAGSHRPLQTLVEKEKEIAVSDYRSRMQGFGKHLKRQVDMIHKKKEKDKLKAKMLFSCSLKDKSRMSDQRAEFLALRMSCSAIMSEQQKIMALYPCNEIIIEMYDGSLITINTDGGWIVHGHEEFTAEGYLRWHGWDEKDIKGSRDGDEGLEEHLVTSLVLVGAKNIYVIDM